MTTDEALELYIRKCKVNNLSPETIATYKIKLQVFLTWLSEEGITQAADITADIIDDFKEYLHDSDIKDTSVVSYLREIRAFLYYCMDCGYMKRFKVW